MSHPFLIVSPGSLPNLPLFDGFPYLTTRLVPAANHVLLLPDAWGRPRLLEALEQQVAANEFEAGLVLSPRDAVFLAPGSELASSHTAPRSSAVLAGGLQPAVTFDPACLGDRPARLDAFCRAVNGGGCLLGDPAKGGRLATYRDHRRFSGRTPEGVPRGLERCPLCGEWRGQCLDRTPDTPECLVPVHCRCQNTTRCAGCLHPFRERRVGGNQYNEADGCVWHWPGFMALQHRCPTTV